MEFEKVTIILGAGASAGYARHPYPLLSDLLPRMLESADAHPDISSRYRLYLSHALKTAYGLGGADLEEGRIPGQTIEREFNRVKSLRREDLDLSAVFQRLETVPHETGARAYWALTYAIGVYMTLMAMEANHKSPNADRAHKRLVDLINALVATGTAVSVVDFNYDCVLEHVTWEYGSSPEFGWNVGRKRQVLADEEGHLSDLAEESSFQIPLDEKPYKFSVGLIKPHGDRCTFLRGSGDVFYLGGRHSHKNVATFPPRLNDLSVNDKFVRSSIMPPTRSRFRHGSSFYQQEERRFRDALRRCQVFVIIGWSARGTDSYYHEVFEEFRQRNSSPAAICVVDKRDNGESACDLEQNLRTLFGDGAEIKDVQVSGFSEGAVKQLGRMLRVSE